MIPKCKYKKQEGGAPGWSGWVGTSSHNRRVVSSASCQGTYLMCRFELRSPAQVCAGGKQSMLLMCTLMFLSLPSLLSKSNEKKSSFNYFKKFKNCLGSVDWLPACESKGHQFNSQSGHRLGLQVWSPFGGGWEATNHGSLTHRCFSLSPSPPLSLKINK